MDEPIGELRAVHYPGDLTTELPGRILGPDEWGGFVVIVAATFDAETNTTTAGWRPATPAMLADRVYDGFGQMYLLELVMPEVMATIPMAVDLAAARP